MGCKGVSCHFCEDEPLCKEAGSSNEEAPSVAKSLVGGRLENTKGSLITVIILLTYFIQPWHFARGDPSNSTVVLRHRYGDLVFGCFQLLFLILSKAICQQLNKDVAKKPDSVIHGLLFFHYFIVLP